MSSLHGRLLLVGFLTGALVLLIAAEQLTAEGKAHPGGYPQEHPRRGRPQEQGAHGWAAA